MSINLSIKKRYCYGSQDCYFITGDYCKKYCCRKKIDLCYQKTFNNLEKLSKNGGK